MDYGINSKNRLTISQTESDNPSFSFGQNVCPINCETEDVSRENAQISDVYTFSSSFQNEARMGFTDQLNFFGPETLGKGYPAKLGYSLAKADLIPAFGPGSNITGSAPALPRHLFIRSLFTIRPT